ncbi:MAG: type II secretion system F family protein [Oscillospiraceae bacterium]|nr:type II secretion system F family protein [Oscillospiraceae bacterium]
MQKYKYTAVNLQKQKIRGVFIAKDEEELALELAKQSLFLISAQPYSGGTPSAFFTTGTGKVSMPELTSFCRQFAIMLNTHIPILDSLDILKNQPYSSYFRNILSVVFEDVQSGILLSDALNKHAKVFPNFFRSMIKVGELSGKLDMVLTALADYYEKDSQLRGKIKGAMAYPTMLAGMTLAIVVLMLALVVPTFRETLTQLEVVPTGLTAVVYAVSDFLLAWWQLLLAGIVVIGLLIFAVSRTEFGGYAVDVLKLKLPIIKTIQINMITARFARAFALLLSSGMDLNEAMYATEIVIGNKYLTERFHQATEAVRAGMSLTNAFESYNLFPPMMIQMITIGEKTNALDDVLTRSCNFFDNEVETSMNSLTNKIQPIMLLIMGAIIGTLFLAVYSPMISIMTGLSV